MNTAGKSDIFEAVVQILVLRALQERGTAKSEWLVKKLQHQAHGVSHIEEHSVHIALRKLETSGWIKRERSAPTAQQSGKWELTASASKCLPLEIKQWKSFIDDWPLIVSLVQAAIEI